MRKTTGAIGRGSSSPAFRDAVSEINLECAKFKNEGRKAYITKSDVKAVYAKYKGSCAWCGFSLRSHKRGSDSLVLTFFQPLRFGGKIERDNLLPVCRRCKDNQSPSPRLIERIPSVNTVGDLVDRLVVEVNKLAYYENQKRMEQAKIEPNKDKVTEWDNKSRDCCELRSMLKRELNTAIEELVYSMHYCPRKETRTFRAPVMIEDKNTIADVVAEMCYNNATAVIAAGTPSTEMPANTSLKKALDEQFESIAATKQYKIIKE